MSSNKSSNLSQLISGWKEKTKKEIFKNRINRLASGFTSESNKINKNPEHFIPELPQDIRNRFTQDDTHLSDKSSNSIRAVDENQKSFDNETLKSSKSKTIKLKANDSSLISNSSGTSSTRIPLEDRTNNQAENSRRDSILFDKTDNIVSGIIEQDNTRITRSTLKQINSKGKYLNSTAITSATKKASNFPITPILHKKPSTYELISSEEEFNDEVDNNFEKSVHLNKNRTSLRPLLSSTANTTQLQTTNKSISKQKDSNKKLELQSRKSLNFKESGRPEHELRSNQIDKERPNAENKNESDDFSDKSEQISRTKSKKRTIIVSDTEEDVIVFDQDKTLIVDPSSASRKSHSKSNALEVVPMDVTESVFETSPLVPNKSKIINKSDSSTSEVSLKSKTINKSNSNQVKSPEKSNNETSSREPLPQVLTKPKSSINESIRSNQSMNITSDESFNKSREQSINNLKQVLSSNRTVNKSTPRIIESKSIRIDTAVNKNNISNESIEHIEEPMVQEELEKHVTKSTITIQRILAKPKPIETPVTTNQANDFIALTNTDPFDQFIDLTTNRRSKLIQKTPLNEISLNQTDTELKAVNDNIYLKKPFTRSISNITSSVNMSSSYSRKTPLELKQSLLSNKQSKFSFAVPPLPNQSKNKSDESKNSGKSSFTQVKNKNNTVQNEFGFSNIEPADMFSPSNTINEPNTISKETSSQSMEEVTDKKSKKTQDKTRKQTIKNKKTDNKENKKSNKKSPQKSRKISESPPKQKIQKKNRAESPKKYSQSKITKNFLVTRKTLCPLSPSESIDSSLRRSKRVKVNSDKRPIYEFQRIKDFTGEDVIVQTIVATTDRTCRLEDYLNEIERKKNHVSLKPKSRIIRPRCDLSDSEIDEEAEAKLSQKTKSNKKHKASSNETEMNESVCFNKTMEPIMLRMNETNLIESSLAITQINDETCNLSQESFIFESEDAIATKKHIFTFSNKINTLDFEQCYEGVGLKAFTDKNGVLSVDPETCTKTQIHPDTCELTMQKGECYISLNGNISKIRVGDVVIIPENCYYKIKNNSSTENAYCYFRFI